MEKRNLVRLHALHSTFLLCLLFHPECWTLLILGTGTTVATWHPEGVCIPCVYPMCVPKAPSRASLTQCPGIVEANPRKFNLDATELGIRKAFITSTRQVVRDMKDQMSNSSMQALAERKNRQALLGDSGSQSWSSGPDKYSRLDRELQLANSHFIEEQQAQQQLIVEQQDEQLELVSGSIGVLKNMSQRIGGELEEQAVMLDDFSHELDSTQSRLDNVMKKLAKVSHMTSDRRQWCAIVVLFVILLVVLILFFVL
ncbi:syntaxin-6 isoform 1-T1 [Sylvia borin]